MYKTHQTNSYIERLYVKEAWSTKKLVTNWRDMQRRDNIYYRISEHKI